MAKSIAIIMVAIKITFSLPLLVWRLDEKLSPPPKALPKAASDCCTNTANIRSKDSTICTYGMIAVILMMIIIISELKRKANVGHSDFFVNF